MASSDPVELDVPALSDLAISVFVPETTEVKTLHVYGEADQLRLRRNRDSTAAVKFPVAKTIRSWPISDWSRC